MTYPYHLDNKKIEQLFIQNGVKTSSSYLNMIE